MLRLSASRRLAIAFAGLLLAFYVHPADADSSGELVYVGLYTTQVVNVYQGPSGFGLLGQLLDGVGNPSGGLAVDKFQKLFIATDNAFVDVFERGSLVPSGSYPIGVATFPLGIAIGQDESLYAPLNLVGRVVVYAKGERKSPSLTIFMPAGDDPLAVAVDAQNDVYIEYAPSGPFPQPAHIEKCPPGSSQCTDLGITLGDGGLNLALDGQGDLVACDELAAQIDVFPPGATVPSRTLTQGLHGCDFFAFNRARTRLFVDNEAFGQSGGGVTVLDYGSGAQVGSITAGIPPSDFIFGIAVSPSAP